MRTSKVTTLLAVRRDLAQLETRFRNALASYEGLRDACDASVVRWQWANGAVYNLDPLFFLEPDIGVGQISQSPPRNLAGWVAYGFASDDRLVAERQYTEFPNDNYYQGFYVTLADRIVGLRFHSASSHTVSNCSQLVLDNARPSYFQRWGSRGWVSYTYACNDHRVDSFVAVAKEHDEPERRFSGKVLYKEDGNVELWTKEQGQRKAALSYRGNPPVDNPFVPSCDSVKHRKSPERTPTA